MFVLPLLFGLATEAAAQTVPTLKVEIPTVTEGETGTIKFTLSQVVTHTVSFRVNAYGGSCGGGGQISCPNGASSADSSDVTGPLETITFSPGEMTKTWSFTTTDDNIIEGVEVAVFQIPGTDIPESEVTIDPSTPGFPGIIGDDFIQFIRIQDNDNPGNPNVTIAPGTSPVTEGTAATFTVTATPAPTTATTVSVAVTEETSGSQDFVTSGNEITHTVSIPASGSPNAGTATLTIPTVGDSTDEPNGAVTATVSGGTGYTVGNPSSATVTVNDDDGGTNPPANNAPTVANAIPNQTATAGTTFRYTFPANTFNDADGNTLTYTAAKADGTALPTWLTFNTRTFSGTPQSGDTGTLSVKVTADDSNGGAVSDTFDIVVSNAGTTTPTITIAGGSAVTEGTAATFTLTASPAPNASLSVKLTVAQSGSFVASSHLGSSRTVSIGTSGTATYTVPTQADTTDEPNGSVTVSVSGGTGYTVGSPSSATVTVNDDDGTESVVTIKGGHEVREGRGAEFTLTASPAPTWDLPVNVTVTQSGDFVASSGLGTREVIFPANKTSHAFTVATVNDGGRDAFGQTQGQESDGSVMATVDVGTGYTLGSPSSATVNILDDDTNAAKGNHIRVSGRGPATLNEDSRGTRHFRVSRYGDPANTTGAWGFKLCFAGTATPGADYTLDNHFAEERGIAIGADGCTTRRTIPGSSDLYHFYISHVDDPHAEGTETIVVTVTGLNNVFFSDQPGINIIRFTIVDDDTPAPPKPQQGEQDAQPAQIETPSCVSDALLADAQAATTETWRTSPGHVERWSRVLAAFGVDNAYSSNPMTVAEAQAQADRGLQRWKPVAPALECLENPPQEEQPEQAEVQPVTPATPELSLSAGSAVDEGGNVGFTVTADPAPQSDLTITWTVAQSGEYLAAPGAGSRTVTLKAGTTSVALSVATVDDTADEADGSVSVTLGTGTGYTVATGKGSAAVTVRDNDVTFATPELSLSAGSAVDEGGNATFTVTADPAPQSDLTIAWTVAQSGEYLAAPGAGSRTVVLTAGTTSTDLSVATVDDAADEADGSVSVTLGAGTGYTVATGKGSAAVAVRDDDEPVVSIAAGNGVTEGMSASFTVSASPVPVAPLDVTLTVGQSGDFAASGETGSRTVTVPVSGSLTFDVATDDDSADEPNGSVTASVDAGTGYTVAAAPDNAATVAVSDNDAASSGPTLSIADASFKEDQGTVHFTVTLSEPVDHRVTVHYATRSSSPISARAGQDYFEWKRAWGAELWIPAGSTKGRIAAYIYNDSHDEDPETFEMVLFDASDGVSIADGVAVGTITNSDPMPAAWLARFGRAVAEHALRDIADRIAAPRMAGVEGVLAGQALGGPTGATSPAFAAPDRFNSRIDRRFDAGFGNSGPAGQVMSLRDFMLSSSFTATGAVDMTGGSMAFWGRASEGSFDGREGRVSLSGDTMTALLGADYARGPWLLGMALAESEGRSSYADTGTSPPDAAAFGVPAGVVPGGLDGLSVQAGSGEVEGRLTAVIPYLALEASEHVRLWSAMGQGSGTVTVTPALGGRYEAATSWTMMAAGLRGDLLAPGGHTGPALALTSDALWVRTSSEKTRDLAASESDVSRLRLGLEGSWSAALGGDASLTPKLELGARHDGGDAETGFGVELGTGLAWVDPKLGLTFDVSARTLLTHDAEGREDRGVAAQLAFDPDRASARGLSLGLTQDWGGQAAGGLDALFSDAPLEDRTGSGMAESRWVAEAAYGLPVFGGRFTGSPHMGLGLATGARDYTLGWRLTPAAGGPAVSFGVQATRRESDGTVPEHTVGFEINARW